MNTDRIRLPLKKYIIAFALAFLLTIVPQAVLSVLFSFIPPHEKVFSILSNASAYFSAMLAALFCARLCGKRGFLTGLISADIYTALILFAGIILLKNTYGLSDIIRIFSLSSLCGIFGGIIGINFK